MKNILLFVLAIVSASLTSCNEPERKLSKDEIRAVKLDSLITYCHDNGMFNGSIAILKNDTILFNKSYGLADNESQRKINAKTSFYIASVSKQFTAMGIMILQERSQLSYDDPVVNYLPELKSLSEKVTVRHLLHHTSGISDRKYYQLKNPGNQEVFEAVMSQESSEFGEPNKTFAYSNTGYVLLALIIEKVSGNSIEQFYQKEIFNPLEMTGTTTSKRLPSDDIKAQPYNILGLKADYKSSVIGPGGIYSTIDDLIKWNTGINQNTLVSSQAKQLAFSNGSVEEGNISFKISDRNYGYGFGWMPFKKGDFEIVRHDGSTDGYGSLIRKNLTNNVDVILLTNHGNALAMDEIMEAIDDIIETLEFETPEIPLPNRVINELKITDDINVVTKKLRSSIAENDKPDERVFGRLGFTFLNEDMMDEAIGLFELNLELYPESNNALYSLGEAYIKDKRYEPAKQIYSKYLELNPASEHAKERLGMIEDEISNND